MSNEYTILELNEDKITLEANEGKLELNNKEIEVYFTGLKMSTQFLSPKMKVLLTKGSNSVRIELKPSKKLFLYIICKFKKNFFVVRQNYDNQNKEKKVKPKKIYKINEKLHLSKKKFGDQEGKIVFVNKNLEHRSQIFIENEHFSKETKFYLEEIGKGIVDSISFCVVNVKFDNGLFEMIQLYDFCKSNGLSLKQDLKMYIGHRVLVKKFSESQRKLVILIPESSALDITPEHSSITKPKLSEVIFSPIEFNSSNETFLEYDPHQINIRSPLASKLNPSSKLPSELASCHISPQIFNMSLGLVIGLAIFEHLLRFQSDNTFKEHIENTLKQVNTYKQYLDLSKPSAFTSFQDFYLYLASDAGVNIKRIGEALISHTIHDIETLEGIQDLCNLTGLCIHFHDFTEGLKQLKLVPLDQKLKKRPIIKLGKYFNDYFLIYSPEEMKLDNYNTDSQDQNLKKGADIHKKCFPYYDVQESFLESYLEDFLKSMSKKITENIESCVSKIKGFKIEQTEFDVNEETNNLKNFLLKEDIELSEIAFDDLKKINFSSLLYLMPTSKYTCACCLDIIIENQKPKYSGSKNCIHEFCDEHIKNNKYKYCMFCAIKSQENLSSYNIFS